MIHKRYWWNQSPPIFGVDSDVWIESEHVRTNLRFEGCALSAKINCVFLYMRTPDFH